MIKFEDDLLLLAACKDLKGEKPNFKVDVIVQFDEVIKVVSMKVVRVMMLFWKLIVMVKDSIYSMQYLITINAT